MKPKNITADAGRGRVILYQNRLEVRLERETVWLTQAQIAILFGTKRPAITRHLSNIFKSKELNKSSVCSILEHTAADGKVYQTQYYHLDAIISVGYRVNSNRATQFRIWATNVLRRHLVDGYTLNEKRLKAAEHKYQELQRSLKLLGNVMNLEGVSDETKGLIRVIAEYSRALDLLDDFDHERLAVPKGTVKTRYELTYKKAREIIEQMRRTFKDSGLFGREKIRASKVRSAPFIRVLAEKTFIRSLKRRPRTSFILLLKTTVLWTATNGSRRHCSSVFCRETAFCGVKTKASVSMTMPWWL